MGKAKATAQRLSEELEKGEASQEDQDGKTTEGKSEERQQEELKQKQGEENSAGSPKGVGTESSNDKDSPEEAAATKETTSAPTTPASAP